MHNQYHNAISMRTKLSAIWIFVVLNYLYCDVAGLMDARLLQQYLSGVVDGFAMTPLFLLGAAVFMEISIAMTLISRLAPYKINRISNIIFGSITTLAQAATLAVGSVTAYYAFFSVIEIAATASIVWLAWRWRTA